MSLPAIIEKFTRINSIEDGLEILCQFGKPKLGLYDSGWHCNIDMFVMGKGVDFKICSDFGHTNPAMALQQCCERLKETLRSLDK